MNSIYEWHCIIWKAQKKLRNIWEFVRLALDEGMYNQTKIAVANAGQVATIPLVNLWVHIMHASSSQRRT